MDRGPSGRLESINLSRGGVPKKPAPEARVTPGSRLAIGEVRLEITRYTTPCATIAVSLLGGEITCIAQKTNPGWSRVCARVLVGGRVRVGDTVALAD